MDKIKVIVDDKIIECDFMEAAFCRASGLPYLELLKERYGTDNIYYYD